MAIFLAALLWLLVSLPVVIAAGAVIRFRKFGLATASTGFSTTGRAIRRTHRLS